MVSDAAGEAIAGTTVRAVIWDYDGTLVDTRLKNLRVTRAIVTAVTGRPVESFTALASLEAYEAADRRAANWRELNQREYGLSAEEAEEAGRLWTGYQLRDGTATPLFPGIAEVLSRLAVLPQAIFSQNSRAAIKQNLATAGVEDSFRLVVGYEEVATGKQKPAPDGLLYCLEAMAIEAGPVFFVGDHATDVLCARRANAVLARKKPNLRVIAVRAKFGEEWAEVNWPERPDHVVRIPIDVVRLVAAYR